MQKRLRQLGWAYLAFLLLYWCVPWRANQTRPAQVEAYIEQFGPIAVQLGRESGVPHAIILAVSGLESQWGKSELALSGKNYFGIKARPEEPSHCLPTQEYYRGRAHTVNACFRAYDRPRESFDDFVRLLSETPRYAPLFHHPADDLEAWAKGLQAKGYATDPGYAQKLLRVARYYRLEDVDG
jgi:flagellum-specific peptidoglycan hydrolase FlgJ